MSETPMASWLLPPPGGEVVNNLIDEYERHMSKLIKGKEGE